MERHLERLVKQGRLPESMLDCLAVETSAGASASSAATTARMPALYADLPTTVRGRPQAEWVYNHKKTPFPMPAPSPAEKLALGTRISLGRSKWVVEDASIFSVADGKRLAQTPVKEMGTAWESARFEKIRAASLETPLVGGFRLLPELTPGRAFLWGSLLALWGTAATFKLAAGHLGITRAEDASEVLRGIMAPYAHAISNGMQPIKAWLSLPSMSREAVSQGEMVRRLRVMLGRAEY